MFCSNCGAQVDDGTATCPSCGTAAKAENAGQAEQTAQAPQAPPAPPVVAPAPPVAPAAPVSAVMSDADQKLWGMLSHLLGLFTWIIGPLIIYLTKAKESEFVMDQAKESLNFQITRAIAGIAASVLSFSMAIMQMGLFRLLGGLFSLIGVAIWIGVIIFCVMGCIAANKGERYRYPINIKFLN